MAARSSVPAIKVWEERLAQFARLDPGEAFLAVTSIEGTMPRFVAGFSFSGRQDAVEALLAEPRAELKSTAPAGRSDVTMHGGTAIVGIVTVVQLIATPLPGGYVFILYYPAVTLCALLLDRGTGFYAAILSAFLTVLLFIEPRFTLTIPAQADVIGLFIEWRLRRMKNQ